VTQRRESGGPDHVGLDDRDWKSGKIPLFDAQRAFQGDAFTSVILHHGSIFWLKSHLEPFVTRLKGTLGQEQQLIPRPSRRPLPKPRRLRQSNQSGTNNWGLAEFRFECPSNKVVLKCK
jgi:hypothetical protein